MSLRSEFEKLFPVPARVEFFPEENSYGSKSSERIFVRDAEAYRRRWEGFQAGHAAGLEDITFHDLRRTWTSWHLMSGTPMEVVVKLGGWSSSAVVEKHYGHLSESHIKQYANNSRAK